MDGGFCHYCCKATCICPKRECVAIVGSRDFPDLAVVRRYVSRLPIGTTVVSGGARGVDSMAETTARECGLKVISYKADWKGKGKGAGFERNQDIIGTATRVVAFWDGKSCGTQHSIGLAKRWGKPVEIVLSAAAKSGTLDLA